MSLRLRAREDHETSSDYLINLTSCRFKGFFRVLDFKLQVLLDRSLMSLVNLALY